MTVYLKHVIIAQVVFAILVLPSSSFVACNCEGEDTEWSNFSSLCEAKACYEYCKTPAAYDSTVTIAKNTLVEITLPATDPDGDALTYRISSGPCNGTLVAVNGNKVVYSPHENFTGVDSFAFRANDGTRDSGSANVTIIIGPECSSRLPHVFYGRVTVDGKPAPENTTILAVGQGVRSTSAGNPVTVQNEGVYGSAGPTARNLVVEGCIEEGTPLVFYADGIPAEVCDVNTSGPWQPSFPFRAGGVTNLTIRVTTPVSPPDEVSINAMSITISNSTYGFSRTLKLEQDPWLEARVTSGMFTVRISATGAHRVSFQPELRRDATLGIYENGNPLSSEKNVWFGSKIVNYEYLATETRTFDILIFVNERPEIHDVKHITIYTIPPP